MIGIGVKYIYNSINDVKEEILRLIDDENKYRHSMVRQK